MDPNKNKLSTNTESPVKLKPSPVLFDKNGPSCSKKIKLSDTESKLVPGKGKSKHKISIQDQRKKLPIYENRNKLVELIKKHKTLIILGETGSGKTTQIPQYIYFERIQKKGKIAITQPRRVAAISVASRVAQECGQGMHLGELVGYTVRFEDVTSRKTKIKFLTDGMLLRQGMFDRLFMEYSVIILDEAHERTVHTDVLFGIVRNAQQLREDRNLAPLKILVMSATMDVDHFSNFFNNSQAVYVEGRTYPVNVYYSIKPHEDYQTSCVATFFKIHKDAPPDHDVLIFLTGQDEIEACAYQIRTLAKDEDVEGPPVKVCTLYAAQPSMQQMAVFQPAPPNTRKVVISTNIAETSITISGIRYVIDSGMVKVRSFHPSTGLEVLKIQRISQEQAWQRTGRAGRDSDGYCYRLYTRSQFQLMRKSAVPEIQRTNLNNVVLHLLGLGIHSLYFDFINRPPRDAIIAAFEQLKHLGAVENIESKTLLPIGKTMTKFPLDPRFTKVLLSAPMYGCLEEALTIISLLSCESILITPASKREEAETSRQKFRSAYGDHITLLNIFRELQGVGRNNVKFWCHEHFINMRNILHAREIRNQLLTICKSCNMIVRSCGSQMDSLRKCLLTGLFTNIARHYKDREYITVEKKQVVQIHPSSSLHGQQPPVVIFTEVIETTRCYLRGLTTIEDEWIIDIAPDYMQGRNMFRFNSV